MRVRRPAPAPIPTPVFDDGRCSLSRFTDSRCAICAEICPTDALTAEADGLALNRDACTGCGACAGACPAQAIRLPGLLPLPPAAPDRTGAVTLICSRHPHAGRSAGPLCLRALGLEALARLWLDGVRVIRLANVQVRRLEDNSTKIELEITGQLKDPEYSRERVKLRTELSRSGQVNVK